MEREEKTRYRTRDAALAIGAAIVMFAIYCYFYRNPTSDLSESFLSRVVYLALTMVPSTIVLLAAFAFVHFYYFRANTSLNTFLDYGMKKLHVDLLPPKQKGMFAEAKEIRVLKTWFPDDDDIKTGVLEALGENAKLTLLLCYPFSKTLGKRSEGAGWGTNHGRDAIIDSIKSISDKLRQGSGSLDLKFYDEWPGVPLIWCDRKLFMGFYFRGKSSPFWPWIEVKSNSDLYQQLEKQFWELWKKPTKDYDKIYRTPYELDALIKDWESRRS